SRRTRRARGTGGAQARRRQAMTSEPATGRPVAPRPTSRRPIGRKQKRLLVIGGVGVVLAVALALILMALGNQIVYFYTPSDIATKHVVAGEAIRLGGM